jgi:hypothetical protein
MRGWLFQDPCSSPGSQSKIGRHPLGETRGLPIARVRGPVERRRDAFWLLVAPRQPPERRAGCGAGVTVQGRGLPAEGGELARTGDRDCSGALAREVRPALVQATLAAPGDLHDTRVLPGLASGDRLADYARGAGRSCLKRRTAEPP